MKKCIILISVLSLFLIVYAAGPTKHTIAVLALKNTNGISTGEAEIITDRLRIELFKTGNVEVMEREQMQAVLAEQGFQASGACTDEGCMVEIGKLLGVKILITGSMGKLGNLYLLNLRAIDVQTAKITKVVSLDIDGGIEEVVQKLSDIAWQLTSTEVKPVQIQKEKTVIIETPKEKPEEIKTTSQESSGSPDCKDKIFLESVNFDGRVSFQIDKNTYDKINSTLKDALEDVFEGEIDRGIDVEVLTPSQIAQLASDCKSGIVRVTLDSFSKTQSASQFVGTVTLTFYFFSTPRAQQATFKLTLKKDGKRHWGDQIPLSNAIEALCDDELKDELENVKDLKCLDPGKK